ncbi:MAG: signal peptidase II, partial [Peptococcaceae bacterium]|nr:signal peptidase II [Peptococcaceae bacterium]
VVANRFHLTYIENDGVAFGMFAGHTSWFVILAAVVLLGLWMFVWREGSGSVCLHAGSALITAGAIGNMIDRALKASVTDMFDFRIWPVFNVADIAVCVGFFLLIVYIIRDPGEKHER